MNTDTLCTGCGRSFAGERGLRSHQTARFVAMGCKPVTGRVEVLAAIDQAAELDADQLVAEARAASCPAVTVEAQPYNARGRAMLLGTCPSCGREHRTAGTGDRVTIPSHQAAR